MTSNLDTGGRSAAERASSAAYLREFGVSMALYFVALAAMLIWGGLGSDDPARFAWVLLPVLPLLGVVAAVLRHLRRIDEFQRFVQLQGLSVGFGLAMAAAVTVGFLRFAGLDTGIDGWIVFTVGMLGWAAAMPFALRSTRRG